MQHVIRNKLQKYFDKKYILEIIIAIILSSYILEECFIQEIERSHLIIFNVS